MHIFSKISISNGCNAWARLVTDTTELSNDGFCSQSHTAL
jgi:hypothetical protein